MVNNGKPIPYLDLKYIIVRGGTHMTKLTSKLNKKVTKLKTKIKSKKSNAKKSNSKKGQKKLTTLGNLFNFPTQRGASRNVKKNFATSFGYGNFLIDIKSNIKGNTVTLNFNIESKNFNFKGTVTLNERSFNELQQVFENLLSNFKGR